MQQNYWSSVCFRYIVDTTCSNNNNMPIGFVGCASFDGYISFDDFTNFVGFASFDGLTNLLNFINFGGYSQQSLQ
jgi:hypothetical protein